MKNTVATLQQQKLDGDKITMLTAYDYSTAKLVDECGVNTILVGDSLGMVTHNGFHLLLCPEAAQPVPVGAAGDDGGIYPKGAPPAR